MKHKHQIRPKIANRDYIKTEPKSVSRAKTNRADLWKTSSLRWRDFKEEGDTESSPGKKAQVLEKVLCECVIISPTLKRKRQKKESSKNTWRLHQTVDEREF